MNETTKEELTMNAVPKAVNYLIEEIAEMRAMLDNMEKQLGLGANRHRPILIERAAEILQMKVNTVRRLVNNREIPHYKREHNIYFFEDELIKWIEDSKVTPVTHSSFYRK
jgi:predicted HTH domain antitoxin